MKAAVDGAIAWAEKKADDLSSESDSTGPYTSPATCMQSDLDPIAGGIVPAMPTSGDLEMDDIEQSKVARDDNEEGKTQGNHQQVDDNGKKK